jgi:DNA polymerase elongation subunit (family B)
MTTMNDTELDHLLAPRIVAVNPPKILTIDIERLPGRAEVSCRGLTVTGDFWDLSGWKHTIGRRIHPDDVLEWPRTICAAWRWYGAKRVEFAAEWDDSHEAMLRHTWELYHQADIVVGHNLANFDTKKLAAEWNVLGLGRPSPWKTVDTLKVARSQFGYESNTLDALCKRLGILAKTDRYAIDVARAAVAGDRAAQRKLRAYNQGDIVATEGLYDYVRGWIPNHPHIGLWSGEDRSCSNCGSTELVSSGWARTAVTAYAQYRCPNCGGWSRQNHRKGAVTMRAVR